MATAKIQLVGTQRVVSSLRGLTLSGKGHLRLDVGYSMPYAIYVHENLNAYHPVGQAKFVEQPARELKPQMKATLHHHLSKRKRSLEDALKAAGQLLYDASQQLVPVDTGALKASGYVRVV